MHLSDALERYGDMKYSSAAATMGGLDEKGRGVGREVQEEMSKVTRTFTGVRAGVTSYERRAARGVCFGWNAFAIRSAESLRNSE